MNEPTEDIRDFIVSNSSHVPGQDLFVGREPSSPPNCVTLFDSGDAGPQLLLDREDGTYEYEGMQIRVRHSSYNQAMKTARALSRLLHGQGNLRINGTLYTLIQALDSPALLEWDDNNRAKVVVNFQIQRTTES